MRRARSRLGIRFGKRCAAAAVLAAEPHLTAREAARRFGISEGYALLAKRAGFRFAFRKSGPPTKVPPDGELRAMVAAEPQITIAGFAARIGCTTKTLRKAAKRAGVRFLDGRKKK